MEIIFLETLENINENTWLENIDDEAIYEKIEAMQVNTLDLDNFEYFFMYQNIIAKAFSISSCQAGFYLQNFALGHRKNRVIRFDYLKKSFQKEVTKLNINDDKKVINKENIFFIRNITSNKTQFFNLYQICIELTDYLKEA